MRKHNKLGKIEWLIRDKYGSRFQNKGLFFVYYSQQQNITCYQQMHTHFKNRAFADLLKVYHKNCVTWGKSLSFPNLNG